MKSFFKGFAYAGRGIVRCIREERNLRFHVCVAVYVILFSRFYVLNAGEKAALAIVIGGVLALELLNSTVERIVDAFVQTENKTAQFAKDAAAGAVLVFCIGAVCCGVFLFWDTSVFAFIFSWFAARPVAIAALVASLALCGWFVFGFGAPKKHP